MGFLDQFKEKTYIDSKGYKRYINSDVLVHRHIAYKYIYLKNRSDYPLSFTSYQVHHDNMNKLDNRVDNLVLLTPDEHQKLHYVNIYIILWVFFVVFVVSFILIMFYVLFS
jgi:hypothetical protein